jgi:hypothetical protein
VHGLVVADPDHANYAWALADAVLLQLDAGKAVAGEVRSMRRRQRI